MIGYCCSRMEEDLTHRCDLHPNRYDCPDNLIAEVRGGYGIVVHDGGRSIIAIQFCPWCGASLPPIGELE